MSNARALYVHVPFCKHICAYCDFVRVGYNEKLSQQWLHRILEDLDALTQEDFSTIYVGGGTPSALSMEQLDVLLQKMDKYHPKEYTIELNPEDVTDELVALLVNHHVNRVSLGVQTFQPHLIETIHRHHDASSVKWDVDCLRRGGIDNISIDLIYGLPGQSKQDWANDLQMACDLRLEHVSLYSLQIEPNSFFGRHGVQAVDEDLECDMYDMAIDYLTSCEYEHYEISNFAKKNKASKHNQVYWQYEDFVGVGMGASGKEDGVRYDMPTRFQDYFAHQPASLTYLTLEDMQFEVLMMGLRLSEGIHIETYNQKYSTNVIEQYRETIDQHIKKGNLEIENGFLRATRSGRKILNTILLDFM